jgi:hypothetical protein
VSGNAIGRSCFRILAMKCGLLVRSGPATYTGIARCRYSAGYSVAPASTSPILRSRPRCGRVHTVRPPGGLARWQSCARRRAASPYLRKSSGSTSGCRFRELSSGDIGASVVVSIHACSQLHSQAHGSGGGVCALAQPAQSARPSGQCLVRRPTSTGIADDLCYWCVVRPIQ